MTIAGQYASVFTDANSVIYVQMGNIGNDVGENVHFYGTVSYTGYYDQLVSHASSSAADITAIRRREPQRANGFTRIRLH